MKVKTRLLFSLPLCFALIDPEKFTKKRENEKMEKKLKGVGFDGLLIGGTANLNVFSISKTYQQLREIFPKVPIISFLRDASEVNPSADAAFAPMVLNSRKRWFMLDNFLNCIDNIQEAKIELLTLAYLVQEGDTSVSFAVDPLPLSIKESILRKYSRMISRLNFDFAYLEGGSGAGKPVSTKTVKLFKKYLDPSTKLLVGGGITKPGQALEIIKAGADGLVIGTLLEKGTLEQLEKIVEIVRKQKRCR